MGAEIQNGAVLVARAILNSSLWTMRAEDKVVAITCIAIASWKDGKWFDGFKEIPVLRGQFVRSWAGLSNDSGETIQTVRTSVQHLERVGFLTRKPTGRYHVFTIPKYSHYQDLTKYSDRIAAESNRIPNSPLTGTQQDANRELTTYKKGIREEGNNGRKDTEEIAATAAPVREASDSLISLWNVGKTAKEWVRSTPKRIAKTAARLKDGFTKEQLLAAVGNCLKSEWHQGANDRGWKAPGPEWVLHTTERLEEWINKTGQAAKSWSQVISEATNG